MKKTLLAAIASTLLAASAFGALNEGDAAPAFTAPASLAGRSFSYSLKEALAKGPVVVYFYPSAFTAGCNIQAHTFAVEHPKFVAAGASIVGVSLDSIARLNEFSADPQSCAGKIAVASDVDGRIARAYQLAVREAAAGRKDTRGVPIDHGYAERTTFIVTQDGKVAATVGGVSPVENVERALQAVQKISNHPSTQP